MSTKYITITPEIANQIKATCYDDFFQEIAKLVGHETSFLTHFDRSKITIAHNIMQHWLGLFEDKDRSRFDMLYHARPIRIGFALTNWVVAVEDGFAYYGSPDIDKVARELLDENNEAKLETIFETLYNETMSDDEPWHKKGRAMLKAYLDKDVDGFCMAICGWSLESILKRAHIIPDYDGTFGEPSMTIVDDEYKDDFEDEEAF